RLDVGHARVAGAVPAQHRQYLGAARVAVGIEHVVEAGQLVAAVPALVDVGGGGPGGRRVGEQGVGACGGAAVARAGERGQSGADRAVQVRAGGGDHARGEGRDVEL